jgi:acetoin utilization protein AcuB
MNTLVTKIILLHDQNHQVSKDCGIALKKNIFIMNLLAPVSDIMSKNLITVRPDDKLKKVEDIFQEHKVHHILVAEDEQLVGLISKSDYLFFKRGYNDDSRDDKYDLFRLKVHKVSEIMTTGIAKLEAKDKINVAIEIFKENLFHAIPIVSEGKLVGIVTTFDVIKHLAEDRKIYKEYPKSK